MRYFNGESESFSDIPLSPKGTAFQQAIWTALRQIPYGKTASYGGLATVTANYTSKASANLYGLNLNYSF